MPGILSVGVAGGGDVAGDGYQAIGVIHRHERIIPVGLDIEPCLEADVGAGGATQIHRHQHVVAKIVTSAAVVGVAAAGWNRNNFFLLWQVDTYRVVVRALADGLIEQRFHAFRGNVFQCHGNAV